MSFTSVTFFLFLPLVFAVYWVGRGRAWQNGVLVGASYVFYAWWDWRFLGLLLTSSLVDYAVGRGCARWQGHRARRGLLATSVIVNLGMLGCFKYYGFFVESLAVALTTVGCDIDTGSLQIVLPIGISFYTFQTLSYTVDVYRGRFEARRDLLAYLTYVSFFPQLVAGPIERAERLLPQFERLRRFDEKRAVTGCRLVLWGLAKKMLLADNLAPIVEAAYAAPGSAGAAALGLGTVAFAFQIYCDFSAYSDIAAGVGRLFGVELMRNFRCPYFAESLRDFWHRWHVSFSTWLRDYVYIPLGGGRGSRGRVMRNLLITAAVSGLWHGAAWHFVVWGLFHGVALVVERFAVRHQGGGVRRGGELVIPGLAPWKRGFQVAVTFGVVCLGWVLFRADQLGDVWIVYGALGRALVDWSVWVDALGLLWLNRWVWLGVLGLVAVEWWGKGAWVPAFLELKWWVARWAVYSAMVWAILLFGTQRAEEFIYFQF